MEKDWLTYRTGYLQLAKEWVFNAQKDLWEAELLLLREEYSTEHRHELEVHVESLRKALSDRLDVLKNAEYDFVVLHKRT